MPIMSPGKLVDRMGSPGLVVVDCRWALRDPEHGRTAYAAGHIPGAVFADLDTDLSGRTGPGRHPLPEPEVFDRFLGSIGVGPETTVIAYDDLAGAVASRLWWMLTAQGHRLTAVLDGGIQAWIDAGHPLSTKVRKKRIPGPAGVATSEWSGVVPIETVEQRSSSIVLIDSRAPERYRGETEPVDAAAGHIPGATNLPDSTAVEAARFLDPAAQQQRFLDAGIDSDAEVIVHCGSGVTACRNILAAEIAGLRRPLLYVGSWSDWSAAGKPVATGQES